MERITRLLWVIVILLLVLIVKDVIPRKAIATAPLDVNIQRIGNAAQQGNIIRVEIID